MLISYLSGDDSETATPVPMPNTEVKRLSAESSWGISPCEDRTLPGNNAQDDRAYARSFFFVLAMLSNERHRFSFAFF